MMDTATLLGASREMRPTGQVGGRVVLPGLCPQTPREEGQEGSRPSAPHAPRMQRPHRGTGWGVQAGGSWGIKCGFS